MTNSSYVSHVGRFDCSGNNSANPVQIVGTADGYAAKKLDVDTGKYFSLFEIPRNRTDPEFTYLNSCAISPVDYLCYCTIIVNGSNYIVRVDDIRIEYVAKLPDTWGDYSLRFNSGAFSRDGAYFFSTFSGIMYRVNGTDSLVGHAAPWDSRLVDYSNIRGFKANRTGGFGDMVVINEDLTGSGVKEEFGIALNSWNVVVFRLAPDNDGFDYWLLPVRGLYGLTTNFGAGWYFAGHVFFSSNHGLGVFEIPVEDIFLNNPHPIELEMIGTSERTSNNDGLNCLGGSNPWVTTIKPFSCETVVGIMKMHTSDYGYDVIGLNVSTGDKESVFTIPFNRTDPPYTSITSVSLNPQDNIFYGVITIGNQPYLARFDNEKMEFCGKLPYSTGGYVGGSFSAKGNYFYTSITVPPTRYTYRNVHGLKGFFDYNDEGVRDFTGQEPATLTDKQNSSATGMSGLVTVRSNFENIGDEAEYVMGIDEKGYLVVTKDSCIEPPESWLIETNSLASGGFGAAYTFGNRIYFEALDGSGVYEVPLNGLDVTNTKTINLKLAGILQEEGGTDFAGWKETGFNCMMSPSPFYVGDCQIGYHEVSAEADDTCPAGSIRL